MPDIKTGPEKIFYNELEALGATVEAYIVRSARAWAPDLYVYRVTRADKSTAVGTVPWDLNTFSAVLTHAKGE